MPKIFISYRRDDSDFPAHAIYKALAAKFGQNSVFIDVDKIPLGVDFRKHLNNWVSRCDILLAVVGPHWLDARHPSGERRLDDPRDFVRTEIEVALQRDIPVIPVLVGRTPMPSHDDLPAGLKDLSYRNAVIVRSGRDFDHDMTRIISGIETLLHESSADTGHRDSSHSVPHVLGEKEDALARLCAFYIQNVKAYSQREKVRNESTGELEEPDERLMRSIEEKINIREARKDDFRREIMNYIGALAIDGKQFNYKTNERLRKALELKLSED